MDKRRYKQGHDRRQEMLLPPRVDILLLYSPQRATRKLYALDDGTVDKAALLIDIMLGNNTIRGVDLSGSSFTQSRVLGTAMALGAARAFEGIQSENKKYR